MSSNSSHPPLERLPDELIIMIIEELSPDMEKQSHDRTDIKDFKALRLTCRRLSYLRHLKARMFHTLHLTASPDRLRMLESGRFFSDLVSYVRRIEFRPWEYSWAMDEGIFRPLFVDRKLLLHCKTNPIDVNVLLRHGTRVFIRKHLHGVSPAEFGHVLHHLEIYSAHARYSKHLFETRRFVKAWARVLRTFSRNRDFRIGSWDCDGEERPQQPDHDFFPHTHDEYRPKYICRRLQLPVGEALFRDAAAALRQSAVTISRLDISHARHTDFRWAHDTDFTALDLSSLRKLFIQHPLQTYHGESIPGQPQQQSLKDARTAIATVLRKCSNTLEELVILWYGDWDPIGFPAQSNEMPHMPNLEHLMVAGHVRLRALANMIKRSTGLRTLALETRNRGDAPDWRRVWRAIRDHPNALVIDCDAEDLRAAPFILQRYTRGEHSRPYDDPAKRSVIAYISKRGRWDHQCQKAFTDYDSDSEVELYIESSDELEESSDESEES